MANKVKSVFNGLDTDTDINMYQMDKYYGAKNLRRIANDSLNSGGMSNIKSPSLLTSTEVGPNTKVLGTAVIRDTIIIFAIEGSPSGISLIYSNVIGDPLFKLEYSDSPSTSKLNFDPDYPIKAIGKYENINARKVYWCDGLNPNSFINISDSNIGKEASLFRMTPNSNLKSPIPVNVFSGGILPSGVIYYSYILYKKFGNQTTISPSSFGVPLSSRNGSSLNNFRGDELGVNSNQAVELNFTIDTAFDHIKIYSIHFADLDADPIINLISEQEVASSSLTFVDTGSVSLETISTEEFLLSGGRIFSSKTLESKFNYLFSGNIKEVSKSIDFDARVYRCDSAGESVIYENNGSTTTLNSKNDPVAEDSDAINRFNDFNQDLEYSSSSTNMSNFDYRFKFNGTTHGGEGPNIEYSFIDQEIHSDSNSVYKPASYFLRYIENEAESFLNPILAGKYKGYKRNEVYRFGIEFHFKNGQKSFVKWIGDIRFPTSDFYPLSSFGNTVRSNQLGLRLGIDLSSISSSDMDELSGFRIVRAVRNEIDKNILGQGLIGPYQHASYNDLTTPNAYMSYPRIPGIYDISEGVIISSRSDYNGTAYDVDLSETIYEFNSPDFIIGSQPSYSSSDKIQIRSRNKVLIENPTTILSGSPGGYMKERGYYSDATAFNDFNIITNINSIRQTNSTLSSGENALSNFNGETIYNRVLMYKTNVDFDAIRSSHLLLDIDSITARVTDTTPIVDDEAVLIGDYIRNKFGSQYNGNTYEARALTNYVPALCRIGTSIGDDVVEFISMSDLNVSDFIELDVFGGDTFVSNFDMIRTSYDQDSPRNLSIQEYITFPVETEINLDYRRDEIIKYFTGTTEHDLDSDVYKIQQTKSDGITLFPTNYPDELTDLYLYNNGYSRNNDLYTNTEKPNNFSGLFEFDSMVIPSNKKFNGEDIDSWTKNDFNTYLEVDSIFGPINSLKNYNDKLFFFQNNGFGVLSVNERVQVPTGEGAPLTLGTGGLLERYDYVSTEFGVLRDEAVLSTPNNLYFIDETDKSIRIISNSDLNGNLSKMLKISNKLKNELLLDGSEYLALGFDPENKEVLFSFDDSTLVFSELDKQFIGDYDIIADSDSNPSSGYHKADRYNHINDSLIITSSDNAAQELCLSKANQSLIPLGDSSEITLLIHPSKDNLFSFDVLDISSHVFSNLNQSLPNNTDIVDDTVSSIEYSNSYLSPITVTTDPGSVSSEITRLVRSWRTRVPQTAGGNRFVDSYILAKLVFDNSTSRKFSLRGVTTHIRPAKIKG